MAMERSLLFQDFLKILSKGRLQTSGNYTKTEYRKELISEVRFFFLSDLLE